MRRLLPAIPLLLLLSGSAAAQVVTSLGGEAEGVVTSVEHGAVGEDDYAASGILSDWDDILEEFENTEDDGSVDKEILSLTEGEKRYTSLFGKETILQGIPQILTDDGTDLFLLTEDGINIYMAADSPVYFQDIDEDVVRWVRFYARTKKDYTRRLFDRYRDWEPRIKAYFRSIGVPEELSELCLIESGCTYSAKSSAGALGMWQIMPGTGRTYGMRIDSYTDERLDPVLSTETAGRILRDNYRKLGEWTIAAAAYNCGSGRFKQGQQWADMKARLPKETQQYIPGLMAIHYVWTYKDRLGF